MLGKRLLRSAYVTKKGISIVEKNAVTNKKVKNKVLTVSECSSLYSTYIKGNSGTLKKESVVMLGANISKKEKYTKSAVEERLIDFYTKCISLDNKILQKEENIPNSGNHTNYPLFSITNNGNGKYSEYMYKLLHVPVARQGGVTRKKGESEMEAGVEAGNEAGFESVSLANSNRHKNGGGNILLLTHGSSPLFSSIDLKGEKLKEKTALVVKKLYKDASEKNKISVLKSNIKSYLELSKCKLTLWVTISSTFGYFMLGGSSTNEIYALAMGVFLCSSSANSFNQIIERNIDKIMKRTKKRPLVYNNKISLTHAKIFAFTSAVVGSLLLHFFNNPLTSYLGLFNIFLYACIYTPLKLITPYNTHVGSIVGSIPTLMGCTAVDQNLFLPEPWILFFTQFLWQFPHFYSLAYLYKEDYLKGKYKMFPLQDKQNGIYTAKLCRPYLILLSSLPFIFFFCGYTSYMYILTSLFPNLFILYKFQRIIEAPSKSNFRSFFKHSLWHIILLLALSAYHTQVPACKNKREHEGKHESEGEHKCKNGNTNDSFTNKIERNTCNMEGHNINKELSITKFKKKLLKFCVVFS
ncbi:protoheme IX farnesyltransferase [Plasmodium brasilianum]|uniref:Heme O synthase n=2 Tax=Plasmodium (Plasmodium) TaxID=418103 RepID=A0A1A8X9J4_PLAMA|nr:protoheme IX farnesyltransferase, putative [Plasmodium malariae]KAI4837787.1 protoheme IX farnesyltransferase [Plasmodium brasilianum]SBT00939.1 cytochrome c oxidase assembly protein, putative [Plasmodium malariae]SCN44801.1 protoheme IX farnesyltransferase, putative [Plasmodium malariae]